MNWPDGYEKEPVKWMTEAQQQAIWDFVHNGGGFLPLHNAQGISPLAGSTTSCLAATTEDTWDPLFFPFEWRQESSGHGGRGLRSIARDNKAAAAG